MLNLALKSVARPQARYYDLTEFSARIWPFRQGQVPNMKAFCFRAVSESFEFVNQLLETWDSGFDELKQLGPSLDAREKPTAGFRCGPMQSTATTAMSR
jgi:hypothetical protein